jgi:hypothetical protein
MVFQGFLINLFQASQLSVTVSSCDLKTLFDNQLSRMSCQMLSTGLSSGDRGVPSCLTQNGDRMNVQRHLERVLLMAPLHRSGIAARQHQGGCDASRRTDGAEDIGRLSALVMRDTCPAAAFGPAPSDLVLQADPGFVLGAHFYTSILRERGTDHLQLAREAFLKTRIASSFCAW